MNTLLETILQDYTKWPGALITVVSIGKGYYIDKGVLLVHCVKGSWDEALY